MLSLIISISSCSTMSTKQKLIQSQALRNLGEALMSQGQYNEALKELLKAERLFPDDAYLHNDLGLVYLYKKKIELAIDHFSRAVSINPDYADAMNNLGIVYIENHDWDKAIGCLQKVSENILYATPHIPYANLGWAYYNKNQYDTSILYYEKALNLAPDFSIALRGLGRTYMAKGDIDRAIEILEKTIQQAPRFTDAYYDLAKAYRMSFNYELAIKNYEKVISFAPHTPIANKAKTELDQLTHQR